MKQIIKTSLVKGFSMLGLQAEFHKKKRDTDIVFFDKNTLEYFQQDHPRMVLYREGLAKSGMEWVDNFPLQCRMYSLQQMAESAARKNIDGEFAECGCWKGHSAYIISTILARHGFSKSFHIFDSFEGGLSDKTSEDVSDYARQTKEEAEFEKNWFSSTIDDLKKALIGFDFIEIYKGWIPDRFPEVESKKFAFVHVDVDLYQPTLDSLKFFYPRLLPGGVIVVDDYGYSVFPGAKRAVDEFLRGTDCSVFYETPMGSCFIIK
ncbi:MAG: TylF/MycF/NovP-related O-methyltransferase [Nitrospira sp.]|uniref:TylF/MycF/NovP-related O-methyltransferase n=1 Tax=Nitrospira sp. ND1 TaxID=1658518 RepID=UPI0009BC1BB2|nr:TylF/MycF/NovP-related O-methyltransferase [Nitrospira sp. ND1]MBK7420767.1 class I SAM-dependent methyltransferase [Nitrospira sp.]MBK7487923.1 class I SAM-dependent methyltransferase [Nitrospira sp.]MBK9996343.1 class I SAM-dependent methyltransferase [Nitrospira sp.]MBP6264293.1 class I SAM-dependent methyltransferase [Nitrospira sp.]MBP6604983.1 class I SAM-dependent methyltransferase [Nitrospira sp.]